MRERKAEGVVRVDNVVSITSNSASLTYSMQLRAAVVHG